MANHTFQGYFLHFFRIFNKKSREKMAFIQQLAYPHLSKAQACWNLLPIRVLQNSSILVQNPSFLMQNPSF